MVHLRIKWQLTIRFDPEILKEVVRAFMDQQNTNSTNGGPPETVEQKIDRLAIAVKDGFDGVDKQFAEVNRQFAEVDVQLETVASKTELEGFRKEVKADLRRMEALMVTKSYLDEKLFSLKGDLIEKLRKEDEKLNFIIALLRARAILSDDDLKRIRTEFQIFPQLS